MGERRRALGNRRWATGNRPRAIAGNRWWFMVMALCLTITMLQGQESPTARWYYEPQYEPPERQVDMLHMRLEVSFEPEKGLVKGRVTHRFTPLRQRVDSLFFNAPGIRIVSAWMDGSPLPFTISPAGITVSFARPLTWNTTDSITIVYEATPRRGLFFVGWNDPTGRSRKQIWTQGQGIDNRNWIPCYDEQNDKLTTETFITFNSSYRALSNGGLVNEHRNADGTTTWHYAMSHPHSVYLVMIGIGNYSVEERHSKHGVPVNLWYYPEYPDRVEPTYRYSAEALDFLERETGIPYPWESYAQIPVQDFLYGGMENTTATVFGDFFLVDRRAFLDRNYISVNVHELTHQWFGDYVTGRSGRQSWLHESFATFYAKLFLKEISGPDAYQWERRREQDVALRASEQNLYPILHSRAGSDRAYSKGSAVIDMMRYVFGEDAFRRVVTHYLQRHAYGIVETNDLYQAFQDVLGLSPFWFFEQWIYRGGEPHYAVSYQDVTPRDGLRQTVVSIRQVHETGDLVKLFTMPVVFEVHYRDGSVDRTRQTIARESETVIVPNTKGREITFVLCDPGSWIIKKITFPKSFAELESQLAGAPEMIDRFDALHALKETPVAAKKTMLLKVYAKEPFPALRAEVIKQIGGDDSPECRMLLTRAISDPAVEVRSAALAAVDRIPDALRPALERLVTDSSYALAASAMEKLSAQFPDQRAKYLAWTKDDRGVGNHIKILWHQIQAANGVSASLDSLVDMAGPSFEYRTRVNAFAALRALNHVDSTLVLNLCEALLHPNNRLRGPAEEATVYFLGQSAYKRLFAAVVQNHKWTPGQQEILKRVLQPD
jgi:aminopeptidase N